MSIDFEDRLRAELGRHDVDVPMDLQAVLDEGREKVRGRRLGWTVAGLAALAVVASVLTPMVIGGTVPAVPAPAASPATATATASSVLGETVWRVTALHGSAPSGSVPLTVEFANGTVYGFGGCNAFSALYEASGTGFRMGTKVSVGAVGCLGAAGTQEQAFLAALGDARTATSTASGLSLLGDDGTSLIDLATLEPDGLTWRLTNLAGEKQDADAATVTLVIDGDHVRGKTGCADYRGDLARDRTAWHVSGIFLSNALPCPSTSSDQLNHFLNRLEKASTWSLTPTTLHLGVADGTALDFTFVKP